MLTIDTQVKIFLAIHLLVTELKTHLISLLHMSILREFKNCNR